MSASGSVRPGVAAHWERIYANREVDQLSWYQSAAGVSLDFVAALDLDPGAAIVDVGAGASPFVDGLLDRGQRDVTVLDVSESALELARARLGERAGAVHWVVADLLGWSPGRRFRLWHDRAVFHFLTDPVDRDRYRELLQAGVEPGGFVLMATFAADGPTQCSGLPVARYEADDLGAVIGPGFTAVRARREAHPTPGGAAQWFTWLLLRRDLSGSPPAPRR